MTGPVIAYAVIHDDPPIVHLAEDLDVLHRVLALKVVARADAGEFRGSAQAVREALLDERWGDAVVAWMDATDRFIDVYTDRVATAADLPAELIGAQLQFSRLFRDD